MGAGSPIPNVAGPYWRDYLRLIESLRFDPFPGPEQLNRLLPAEAVTASGLPILFQHPGEFADAGYEERIANTGIVSTRADNWHDLCNALVWARFPSIKAALNVRHMDGMRQAGDGRRGSLRDALTLFDESGALVLSHNDDLLNAIAARNWRRAFWTMRESWKESTVFIMGHALLEKALTPYRSMTAHTLLLRAGTGFPGQARAGMAAITDGLLARRIADGACLNAPADLGPLPLAGIPGWWAIQEQNANFYLDTSVFRPPRPGTVPAPVFTLA